MKTPGLSTLCLLTLCLSTPFLTSCNEGVKPSGTVAATDSADQVLVAMTHYITTNGILRARVRADTAYMFSATQVAELRSVHVTFYDAQGAETSTLTSKEGTYHLRTGDMEARGAVVVVTTDGRTLRSEVMRYSQVTNKVSSDKDFVFDGPDRHIEGEGFTSDPDFKDVVAKRPKGTGGHFTLPNQ